VKREPETVQNAQHLVSSSSSDARAAPKNSRERNRIQFRDSNLRRPAWENERRVLRDVVTGRQKHGETSAVASGPPPEEASVQQAMEHKLRTEAGHAIYKMRKAIVEPVFGQIKERRGFRRFSFRGVGSVRLEWQLMCLTGNILKLFRSGWTPQTA
jgi:hypothetical protein